MGVFGGVWEKMGGGGCGGGWVSVEEGIVGYGLKQGQLGSTLRTLSIERVFLLLNWRDIMPFMSRITKHLTLSEKWIYPLK